MGVTQTQLFQKATAITKSDTAVFKPGIIYVGTAGNVKVRTELGTTATFVGVQAGQTLYGMIDMVYSTDTTASDFILLN